MTQEKHSSGIKLKKEMEKICTPYIEYLRPPVASLLAGKLLRQAQRISPAFLKQRLSEPAT